MTKTKKSIAQEIEERIAYLQSPGVKWVNRVPTAERESCAILDLTKKAYKGCSLQVYDQAFSKKALAWIDAYVSSATSADKHPCYYLAVFSDCLGPRSLDKLIDMLADAWDEALAEGV